MFSSKKSVKLEKQLYERLEALAQKQGYSSTDELIVHLLEKAASQDDEDLDREQAERQLRGLGYIE